MADFTAVLGALGMSGSLEQRIKDKFGENVDPTITLEAEDSPGVSRRLRPSLPRRSLR